MTATDGRVADAVRGSWVELGYLGDVHRISLAFSY